MTSSAGYSSTPLAKKLGIKEGHILRLVNEPGYYFQLFSDWPLSVTLSKDKTVEKDIIHYFTTQSQDLAKQLPLLKDEIKQAGCIWVSWPKKAAKMNTDVTEDVIRNFALQIGLVDIKVCAVDAVWSGLKLVIPVKNRNENIS